MYDGKAIIALMHIENNDIFIALSTFKLQPASEPDYS